MTVGYGKGGALRGVRQRPGSSGSDVIEERVEYNMFLVVVSSLFLTSMSYAAVASHNTSGYQPTADQALLNTEQPHASNIADDSAKVGVVSHDFKEHPETVTSQHADDEIIPSAIPSEPKRAHKEKKMPSKPLDEARAEGLYLWELTKHALFRPGVAGGLVGLGIHLHMLLLTTRSYQFLVNIGLLAGAGRAFYAQPDLRRNTTVISSVVAGTIALLSVEGFAAEKYRQTPSGREEERRAKEEGTLIYKHVREIVLRPGVLGGLVGLSKYLYLHSEGVFLNLFRSQCRNFGYGRVLLVHQLG